MRLASPYPMTADLPEGPMQEPAYPEGDCVRLHGVGSRDQIYLFSLGPHLFVLPIQYAWKAPEPLAEHQGKPQVQHLASTGFFYKVGKAFSWNGPRHEAQREDNETDDTSFSKSFAQIRERGRQLEETERERSLHNVRTARGFLDFRDIERVTIENPSDQVRAVLDDPRSLEGLVEQNSASMQENNPVVLEITLGNGRQMRNEVDSHSMPWKCALIVHYSGRTSMRLLYGSTGSGS